MVVVVVVVVVVVAAVVVVIVLGRRCSRLSLSSRSNVCGQSWMRSWRRTQRAKKVACPYVLASSYMLQSSCRLFVARSLDFCNVSYVFGIHQDYNHDLFPLCTARMSPGSPLTGVTLFAKQRDPCLAFGFASDHKKESCRPLGRNSSRTSASSTRIMPSSSSRNQSKTWATASCVRRQTCVRRWML